MKEGDLQKGIIQFEMAQKFDMSPQESGTDTEPNLSALKKEVEITPSTLKDITNKEEFLERVIELCNNSKESINIERAKEALIYLTEAEKILQYAASCGKTIDKYVIVSVLHNQACCYQKIWELEKCSQYLEALIFNFNSFLKSSQEQTQKNQEKQIQGIDLRTFLAKYYLQFCAVNSQTDNHSGALIAGRKSIQIMKTIFRDLAEIGSSIKKGIYEKKSQFEYKISLIAMCSRLNDNLNVAHYDTIFQAAKYHLRQWKLMKDNRDNPDRNYVLEQQFKNYSIGNAMQIVPIDYKDFQQKDKNFAARNILQKVLLMALGYFTISTELRLIATKKYNKREGEKINSTQYRESEIYHLLSIIIAAACIPFQVLYIKHVLSSYSNHYNNDLLLSDQESKIRENISFEELLFPCQNKNRKVTLNNSFTNSMDPEDTVSKFQKEEKSEQSSNEVVTERKNKQSIKEQHRLEKKKTKNKSKSKSKQTIKSITLLRDDKSQKTSPLPKSPGIHMKSPKSNIFKVKTSYKVKVSTEKIVTTHFNKDEKSKKKRDKQQCEEFQYFMGKSKELKKKKKGIETGMNLPSPKVHNTSRSSSRRQSPVPKYFENIKLQSPSMKTIKSPKSPRYKGVKNMQQLYL